MKTIQILSIVAIAVSTILVSCKKEEPITPQVNRTVEYRLDPVYTTKQVVWKQGRLDYRNSFLDKAFIHFEKEDWADNVTIIHGGAKKVIGTGDIAYSELNVGGLDNQKQSVWMFYYDEKGDLKGNQTLDFQDFIFRDRNITVKVDGEKVDLSKYLNGDAAGATFAGPAVTGQVFAPGQVGLGTYTIQAEKKGFFDGTNVPVTATATFTITVIL